MLRVAEVGLTFTEDGDALRVSKLTGHVIPWPDSKKDMLKEQVPRLRCPRRLT